MRRNSLLPFALVAMLAVTACGDQTMVEPDTTAEQLSVMETSSSLQGLPDLDFEMPPRHLVVLKGNDVSGFGQAVADLGGRVIFQHSATGIAGVEGLDDAGADALSGHNAVSLVEAEPMIPMMEPVDMTAPVAATPASPTDPTSAFFFPRQWNMRAIQADQAWAAGRLGSSDVTVGILDTGIGYTHEDLQGRVDLSRSVSFVPTDDFYVSVFFPGAHPIADIGFHGTHVAATVASNGLVAAGVTSQTTLMGVKVCSVVTGGCPGLAIVQGILHAVDNGADVINMSLGGAFLRSSNPGYVSTVNTLFNYVAQNNVTMVVAAGNDSVDMDRNDWPIYDEDTGELIQVIHYPSLFNTYCGATHVLCVAATGPTASAGTNGPWEDIDAPAVYTNYGRSGIDVAAPGGNTGGSVLAACSTFSLLQGLTICQQGGFVVGASGTSMASPHVAGLAALAVEDVGSNPAQVRAYIRNAADAIGGGNTAFYGKGRINVANATGSN